MVVLKSVKEIEFMRKSGKILAIVLSTLYEKAQPGITTMELNRIAESIILDYDAIPVFKGYNGFPYTICSSKNNEIIHGFPDTCKLKDGDIISIDSGVKKDGYCSDAAFTKIVGAKSKKINNLLVKTTEECLYCGIKRAIPGNRLGDISYAIEKHAVSKGFNIIRSYGGHGIGRNIHEDPHIQNYGRPGEGLLLKSGMTFAIEPMLCVGSTETIVYSDGWTVSTKDKSMSAHFEHTIVITGNGPEILTMN